MAGRAGGSGRRPAKSAARGAPKGTARRTSGPAPRGAAKRTERAEPKRPAPKGTGPKGAPSRGPAAKGPAAKSRSTRSGPPTRQTAPKGLGGTQVEGRQGVRELLLAGRRRTHEVVLADDLDHADIIDDIVGLAGELRVPVRYVPRRQLDDISHTEAAQGVVARAGELPDAHLDDLCRPGEDGTAPFLLAVDGVTDPGNLGAMIRTAEGAGVSGVLLPRHRSVHVTPTVTKAAAGAVEHVPLSLVGGLPAAITQMQQAGIWVVGLDADAESGLFDMAVATEPVCLVVGAEGRGLSRLVAQRCDLLVSIPLRGHLSSLNVSVSAAIACYEIVRRRG